MHEKLPACFADNELVPLRVQEQEALADIIEAYATFIFFRIVFWLSMAAVVNIEIEGPVFYLEQNLYVGRLTEADTVFEGVLYERDEQHRGNLHGMQLLLDIGYYINAWVAIGAEALEAYVIV